jgi:polyisoprenoid-binding protein YceI
LLVYSIVAYSKESRMTIVADTPATVLPTGTWSIDPVWSALGFEVKKIGLVAIKGRALGFSGTIRGGAEPSIEGVVDVRTITTFDETRDGHLQSPDFFDSERFPALRFESTSVALRNDELVVEGDLTIKGITRPVELTGTYLGEAVDVGGNDRIAVELTGTVDRTEFDLVWNAPVPGGNLMLPNDVSLHATFAAVRAA